jgi:hypothetical protein
MTSKKISREYLSRLVRRDRIRLIFNDSSSESEQNACANQIVIFNQILEEIAFALGHVARVAILPDYYPSAFPSDENVPPEDVRETK